MRASSKATKNFASPLVKGEDTKKGQEFENAFEYAILRYRHRQEQKTEAFGATDGRNDLSSFVLSDMGDEREKRPPDSLKTTLVLNSRAWTSLFSNDLRDSNPIYKELEYI